jgi:hypothetical protein
MSQQYINIGAQPNDGLGDPIRTAFEKTNENFTQLYAETGNISNVIAITGNGISVTGNISANYFIGNGSLLTGISGGNGGNANTGNVTFDNVNVIGTGNLNLQPDPANNSAYLDVYLTTGPDIHIAGNGESVILGTDDYANVTVNVNGNVSIQASTGSSPSTWTFGTDGGTIFPTLTTQRGDNPSGTIAGQTLLFGDNTQEAIITTPDGNASYTNSQRLVINPGEGFASGEGGDIYLWAGRGGATNGSGGDIKIRGGQGMGDYGTGGYLRIEAGDSQANGQPGFIEITGGQGGNTTGGPVTITGGQGATVGGDAKIYGGYGQTTGGNVNIWGGASGNGQANEGHVNIETGGNTWIFSADGTITLPNQSSIQTYSSIQTNFNTIDNGIIQINGFDLSNNLVSYFIVDGTSNVVMIGTADPVTELGYQWTFDQYGNLSTPGVISAAGNIYANNTTFTNNVMAPGGVLRLYANPTEPDLVWTITNDGYPAGPNNSAFVSPLSDDIHVGEIFLQATTGNAIVTYAGPNNGINSNALNFITYGSTGGNIIFELISDNGNVGYISTLDVTGNLTIANSIMSLISVTPPTGLANLTAVAGGRAFIDDGNLVAASNFGVQVGNGGSNVVPVWSDGVNWYIG